jgi:hypothetical protein
MSKRQIKLLGGAFCLLLSLIMISSVASQSFDPVFEWTRQFQKGEEIELRGYVSTSSFTFLRSQATNINQGTFDSLLGDSASQLPAELKILPGGELVIRYEVNKWLHLEETWKEDKPKAWKKIEFVQIASYPLVRWPDFIRQAVSEGLMEYQVIEDEVNLYVSLTFGQTGPSQLQFGKRSLKFSDEFYAYMRTSPEFKPWAGTADKFVVLVHEPHWSLAGQYQLISGLEVFLDANSQYKFRFLVEGYFAEETKYIPTGPLLERFSSNVSTNPQVFSLLRNFLIDGPFAYRLLYDPDLPAVAIDDPQLIERTPPEQKTKGLIETSKVLRKIDEKLQKLPSNEITEAQSGLSILSWYVRADISDLKGQAFIDYQLQLAELYDALGKSLSALQSRDFNAEISFLDAQARAYRTNARRFQNSLERDATMARNILEHFTSKEHSDLIPIVFVGNFHTPAITSQLRSQGIGYVVIEPRASLVATEKEQDNFNKALNLNTRLNYLKELAGDLKLTVAPTEAELTYYQSFLRRRVVPGAEEQNRRLRESFGSFGSNKINLASLSGALEANGFLNEAQVSFGGFDRNHPPPFERAFGYFSLGPQGKPPELVFFQPKDEGWERQDRYRFLQKVSLILPYEEIQRQTRKVRFFQDQETKKIFCTYFDPQTQRFYLFEGDRIDIFKALPLPKEKDEEEALIHMRISIRDKICCEKEKVHG